MGHVVAENFLFETPQGGTRSSNLSYDINAVSILLDHSGQSSDLPLDTSEALSARRLDVISHPGYIPLLGIGCKPSHRLKEILDDRYLP